MPDQVTTFEPDPPAAVPPLMPGDDSPSSPAAEGPTNARTPLGPGDDDPRSPAGVSSESGGPLGPGDDDPRSPASEAGEARGPLGPGESDGPVDESVLIAPPAAGPGSPALGPRRVGRVVKAGRMGAISSTQDQQESAG